MVSPTTRKIVTGGVFIALAVGLGYALASFPNVELVTATVFLAGIFSGWKMGAVVGALSMFIYSTFNPYGLAAPPVLAAQVVAMALSGASGGWLYPALVRLRGRRRLALFAVAGAGLTAIFDFLTTVGDVVFLSLSMQSGEHIFQIFLARIAFGVSFFVTHIVSNAMIFALLLPHFIRRRQAEKVPVSSKTGTAMHAEGDLP